MKHYRVSGRNGRVAMRTTDKKLADGERDYQRAMFGQGETTAVEQNVNRCGAPTAARKSAE